MRLSDIEWSTLKSIGVQHSQVLMHPKGYRTKLILDSFGKYGFTYDHEGTYRGLATTRMSKLEAVAALRDMKPAELLGQ